MNRRQGRTPVTVSFKYPQEENRKQTIETFLRNLKDYGYPDTPLLQSYEFRDSLSEPYSKYYEQAVVTDTYQLIVNRHVKFARYLLAKEWSYKFPLVFHDDPSSPNRSAIFTSGNVSFALGNLTDTSTYAMLTSIESKATVEFQHFYNKVSLFFDVTLGMLSKIEFKYSDVRRMVVNVNETELKLYFQLKTTPLLYISDRSYSRQREFNPELTLTDARVQRTTRLLGLEAASFGKSTCYCITIPQRENDLCNLLCRLMNRVNKFGEIYFVTVASKSVQAQGASEALQNLLRSVSLENFDVLYTLQGILNWSDELLAQISLKCNYESFVATIRRALLSGHSTAIKNALEDIYSSLENGNLFDFDLALDQLYEKYQGKPRVVRVVPGTNLVRRVFVTPSRTILRFAELHTSNRILRNYESEYAIRVSFRDDDLQKLTFGLAFSTNQHPFLRSIVGGPMRQGIQILDRSYQFMAASSSQLRDHGLWFYSVDSRGRTADFVRQEMGDFSGISNVGKKMARMGQCLSSTQQSVIVENEEYQVVEDVTYPHAVHPQSRKEYCFSDGVGTISTGFLEDVAKKLEWLEEPPSALQIRFRGCKGMLCHDPTLNGKMVQVRKSMEKFSCPDSSQWYLEVIKRSSPMPLYLNRPFIALLEYLGIQTKVFVKYQQRTIITFADSLVNPHAALMCLTAFVKTNLPFKKMQQAGWDLVCDPFCINMLFHLLKDGLSKIRQKARIQVPLDSGRNFLGVMDETGTLEYGQVFIQYSQLPKPEEGNNYNIVTGKVVVTKCPCLHPGDVRTFQAVDVEKLRHIKDCIVFPSKGPRPHPCEMAGSDLDGDEFIAIWNKDFIFPSPNATPYTYEDKPAQLPRDFGKDEEVGFFINYIINDVIGVASNCHLAHADLEGPDSEECIGLVQKVSTALDFSKTGIPVILEPEDRPSKYPDFMEKRNHKHTYKSQKSLGVLYRNIRQIIVAQDANLWSGEASLIEIAGWRDFKDQALKARDLYNERLKGIMNQHGVSSEAEIFTGAISRLHNYNLFKSDRENVEVVIEKQRNALLDITKKQFFDELKELCLKYRVTDLQSTENLKMQLASAWFMVVYADPQKNRNTFYSFSWCIAEVQVQCFKWIRDQSGDGASSPRFSDVLVKIFNDKIAESPSSEDPLHYIRVWLKKTPKLSALANCDCIRRVFAYYSSLDDNANKSKGDQIIGFIKHIALYDFRFDSNYLCYFGCDKVLMSQGAGGIPSISIIAAHKYVEICINKDPCCFGLRCHQEYHNSEEAISDGDPGYFDIETTAFRQLLSDDRPSGFAMTKQRLSEWTGINIDDIEIRMRRNRRRRRGRQQRMFAMSHYDHYNMTIEYSGTQSQLLKMEDYLYSAQFESAFVSNSPAMLKVEY